MLYSSVGYYSLIFGLAISLPLIFFSIRNFRNEEVLDYKILTFSFIQLFLVIVSFFGDRCVSQEALEGPEAVRPLRSGQDYLIKVCQTILVPNTPPH